ncbi:sulfite exporter TauE/SafE family protein [Lederbergia citri]|uniref:Probable membrane transporter protein n=1 Tax=Lederbergia citri TaxID=2833580 RepID=A0A942TEY3_9BACI|nr:sulfite exporter TauE/SafE family protein [Lederbergia citri]MBS4194939.1 sulfite exporter TauE/SafE family protein [Lederbergia citri]
MEIGIIVMGLVVGFLVGLTGVGGASLLTPTLMLIGINPVVAVGTDLLYNSVTKLFGTIQHWRQKTIKGRLVLYLSFGSIPGAIIAIVLLKFFDFYFQNQEQIIKHSIGYVLVFVAAAMIFQNFFSNHFKTEIRESDPIKGKKRLTIVVGFLLGFIVGLTSIGSGSLFALAFVYIYRIRASKVVGTDIAHAFALVTVAGLLHAGLGNVDYLLAANLLIGSIPGVILGSKLSTKVPAKPLRIIIGVIIFISGIKLIF